MLTVRLTLRAAQCGVGAWLDADLHRFRPGVRSPSDCARPIPTRSRLLLRNNLIHNADQGLHGHAIPSGRRGQLVGGCARLGLGGKALDFFPATAYDLERVEVLPIGIKDVADDGMKPPEWGCPSSC